MINDIPQSSKIVFQSSVYVPIDLSENKLNGHLDYRFDVPVLDDSKELKICFFNDLMDALRVQDFHFLIIDN